MKKSSIRGVLVLMSIMIAAALAWSGGDPWKDKSYKEWTMAECLQILQDSPWAKVVPVGAGWHPMGQQESGGGEISPGGGGASAIRPAEAEGSQGNDKSPKPYAVVWTSAIVVQQANMRRQVLNKARPATDLDNFKPVNFGDNYGVMVNAADMSLFKERGEGAFMDKAYLQVAGSKEKIEPAKVFFFKDPQGKVTGSLFYFPKIDANGEPTIKSGVKRIDFYLQVGEAYLQTYFEPDKMATSQGPDL
ncbi:MAG: hypothetical protein ACRD50_13710 [Candidatus Acidiferrales bacterium]